MQLLPTTQSDRLLCRDGDHAVAEHFEEAVLLWPDGRFIMGDFYGHPSCAIINHKGSWCLAGGEGLIVCFFEDGLPSGPSSPDPARIETRKLWRDDNPPPDGKQMWFVEGAWFYTDDLVRVVVNPLAPEAGLYEVDVRTLAWRRL